MGLQLLRLDGATMDGDKLLYGSAADYVAGQPCKTTANGVDVATTAATCSGVFKNDKSLDAGPKVGPQVGDAPASGSIATTVVFGSMKVQMSPGLRLDGTSDIPFVYTGPGGSAGAWAVGQKLYVGSGGKWDNQAQTSGDQAFGEVTKAPTSATDTLEAVMLVHFVVNDAT